MIETCPRFLVVVLLVVPTAPSCGKLIGLDDFRDSDGGWTNESSLSAGGSLVATAGGSTGGVGAGGDGADAGDGSGGSDASGQGGAAAGGFGGQAGTNNGMGGAGGPTTEGDGGPADGSDDVVDARSNDASTEMAPPLSSQTLAPHGATRVSPNAQGFSSQCEGDEVVVGFTIRFGVWTDAIAAICGKFSGGVLGATRTLPLNGSLIGGSLTPSLTCLPGFVAAGITGNSGHSDTYGIDGLTGLGVICRDLQAPSNSTVTRVLQPPLDSEAGPMEFTETCTTTQYLTGLTGTIDYVNLGVAVVRFGGECNTR